MILKISITEQEQRWTVATLSAIVTQESWIRLGAWFVIMFHRGSIPRNTDGISRQRGKKFRRSDKVKDQIYRFLETRSIGVLHCGNVHMPAITRVVIIKILCLSCSLIPFLVHLPVRSLHRSCVSFKSDIWSNDRADFLFPSPSLFFVSRLCNESVEARCTPQRHACEFACLEFRSRITSNR